MRSSRLLTRVGSVAAVATIATAGVLASSGIASASARATKHATHLYMRNKVVARAHHLVDSLTGTLKSDRQVLAGETVYLQSRAAMKTRTRYAIISQGTTGSNGMVTFSVVPTRITQYRMLFKATAKYKRGVSNTITLKVLPKATRLSIGERSHQASDTVTGKLRCGRTGLPGQTVYLESKTRAGAKFTVSQSGTTGTGGTISFTVTQTTRTWYVLVFKSSTGYRRSRSGVLVLRKV